MLSNRWHHSSFQPPQTSLFVGQGTLAHQLKSHIIKIVKDCVLGYLTWFWGSVNPWDWDPLRGCADLFKSSLKDSEQLWLWAWDLRNFVDFYLCIWKWLTRLNLIISPYCFVDVVVHNGKIKIMTICLQIFRWDLWYQWHWFFFRLTLNCLHVTMSGMNSGFQLCEMSKISHKLTNHVIPLSWFCIYLCVCHRL